MVKRQTHNLRSVGSIPTRPTTLCCETCNEILTGRQRRYCSLTCKNRSNNTKYQNYESQKRRGEDRKLKLVKMKGGKCQKCGYDKNYSALCFHHLRDKRFGITIRECSNNSWNVLLEEVDKCVLLCHNCHMEEHYPENTIII